MSPTSPQPLTAPRTVIDVAVAIVQQANGDYLLASRPHGKGWAGWWEFPGGKLEQGETADKALVRELEEELGIRPTRFYPWIIRHYHYPATHDAAEKTVSLHFFFVKEWQGEPQAKEGQQLAWQTWRQAHVSPILPANAPIMQALSLPAHYAISDAASMGESAFLNALQQQLDQGLQLLQVREKQLDQTSLAALSERVLRLCHPYQCRCLLNGNPTLAQQLGFAGVHLDSQRLHLLAQKPPNLLTGASCHTREELQRAQSLQLDFALLSPVLPTASHPEAQGLGWDTFATMIRDVEIPVYALGGMTPDHLAEAWHHGARGIAMQRGAWR